MAVRECAYCLFGIGWVNTGGLVLLQTTTRTIELHRVVSLDLTKLTDWIKLKPRYLLAISATTGAVLFLPDGILEGLGLHVFRSEYLGYVGFVFILAAALLASIATANAANFIIGAAQMRINRKKMQKAIGFLTPVEKGVLRGYMDKNTTSLNLNMEKGVTQSLEAKKMIYQAVKIGTSRAGGDYFCDYNIYPWTRAFLLENPESLNE